MDKEFFVQQIEAHSGMLYRVAYTILRNNEACKDALQDAALKAWEKRLTLREPKVFRAWITRILINACYDTKRRSRPVIPIEEAPEPAVPPPNLALSEALASLPEKLRLPLTLCYSEGMTYEEIAQALHLSQAAVRGRIHRAKGELRRELEAE